MSEFLAEARILVRPDTTRFRAELIAEVTAAARGVTVPIQVTPVIGTTGFAALAAESAAAARAQSELAGAAKAKADADRRAAREAAAHARQLGQVQTAALASAASMTGLRGAVLTAGGAFLGTTVAIQAFGRAVSAAADLESELNVFRVTAGATADEMERVREQSIALGRDIRLPAVSAGDAAEAMTNLARAGLDVEDSISGARGVLQLAAAAQIDNAAATELAANALNAFNLEGEESVRVADLLANSSNEAQGSILDMGIALRQSASAAAAIGLSLDDTVGLLTILAQAGLAGSDAGTTLRVALLRLVAPTKEAQKALAALNINLRDARGNVRPEVFFELEEALRGVSRQQADVTRKVIFGENAFRVSALLGRETSESFDQLQVTLGRQGAAAELAAARMSGLTGELSALQSNLETLGTSLGQIVIPPLEIVAGQLNRMIATAIRATEGVKLLASGFRENASEARDSIPFLDAWLDRAQQVAEFAVKGQVVVRQPIVLIDAALRAAVPDVDQSATAIEKRVREMFEVFQEQGGFASPSALNQFVVQLDELADRLANGDAAAQRTAESIRTLIRTLQSPQTVTFDLDFDFDDSEATNRAEQAGGAVLDALRDTMSPEAAAAIGFDLMTNLGRGATEAAPTAATQAAETFVLNLGARIEVAEAQGAGDAELLRLLEERRRRQEAFLNRQLALAQTPARQQLVERIAQQLQATNAQIQQILDRQRAEAESAARQREQTLQGIQDSFLRGLTIRRSEAENRIALAQSTQGLGDDIRAQDALTALIRRQIAAIRREIDERSLERELVAQLTSVLIRSRDAARRLREERRREAEEARQARLDERQRALELNLEFAEITGNEAAQERALRAIISALEKRIRGMKGISNKERELRNELARRRRQLDELRGEQQENNRSAEQFFFEQLQAQQGFAANLLGNLITGPTAGLVGVAAPVTSGQTIQSRITAEAAAAKGRQGGGPTAGQANTTNDILLRIFNQLKVLTSTTEAPEAIEQRRSSGASLDYAVM